MTKRLLNIAKPKYNVVGEIQIEMASSSCLLLTSIAGHTSTKTYLTFSLFFVYVQSHYEPGTPFLTEGGGLFFCPPPACNSYLK